VARCRSPLHQQPASLPRPLYRCCSIVLPGTTAPQDNASAVPSNPCFPELCTGARARADCLRGRHACSVHIPATPGPPQGCAAHAEGNHEHDQHASHARLPTRHPALPPPLLRLLADRCPQEHCPTKCHRCTAFPPCPPRSRSGGTPPAPPQRLPRRRRHAHAEQRSGCGAREARGCAPQEAARQAPAVA